MSKVIQVSESVYDELKTQKGTKSFSVFIDEVMNKTGKIDTIAKLVNDVASMRERVDKLEEFVNTKSGGEYA